jgi:hypothetical protein
MGKNIHLVFVDFENKKDNERPDFYVLTVKDWEGLLEKELTDNVKKGEVTINEKNIPIRTDGYQGTGIKPEMLKEHKEKWNKIRKVLE